MALPLRLPFEPMLARLTRTLPTGDYRYEPKWDGFRCLVERDGDTVELWSRHERPLGRYFPELVEAVAALPEPRFVLDGEIVLDTAAHGRPGDFGLLMARLHPSPSRVARLREETPVVYMAFDVLAAGDEDLTRIPFVERRHRLEVLFQDACPPLLLTPSTADATVAAGWFAAGSGHGVDGVVAKAAGGGYEPGRRGWLKVKHERTADCVLAGVRLFDPDHVSSLLLGLYDAGDDLRHVGVVTQLPRTMRTALVPELVPLEIPLGEHPWRNGFHIGASPLGRLKGSAARWRPDLPLDWVPLRPARVAEVGFDQVDGDRFRHPARFRRWRPDRTAESCRLEQITADPATAAAPWADTSTEPPG